MRDEDLFTARSVDLGTLNNETLNSKVGDLTVRELIRILRMVKSNRAPVIIRTETRDKIKEYLSTHPEGGIPYTMAKAIGVDYGNIKKTLAIMLKKGIVTKKETKDNNLRTITVYKWNDQQTMN